MTTQIEVGAVFTFKLSSGEELVAKVSSVGDMIEVTDPVTVAPGPQGLTLVPSLFTADHSVPAPINKQCIIMYAPTDDSVKVKYIQATTGLSVPEKKILMS